jgi:hypothetical protein
MRKILLPLFLLALAGSTVRAQGPGGIPNPNTVFDIPEHFYDCPLGLPKNDEGEKPALRMPPKNQPYCAYIYEDDIRSKVFDNGAGRIYTVSFYRMNGEEIVNRSLGIADSLAIYMINDKDRTITKMPMNDVAGAVTQFDVKRETIKEEKDVASSQDRWCYSHYLATRTVTEFAGNTSEETIGHTTDTDLETGIVLYEEYPKAYTRNIHVGLFHPEVFELPKGYTFVVQDFSEQMQKMEDFEKSVESVTEQLKELDLGNKSLEDLMKMLK